MYPYEGLDIALFYDAANTGLAFEQLSPFSYGELVPGVTYYLVAEGFSGYTFSSWSTGSTTNNLPVSATTAGQVVSIVAIYSTTVTSPPSPPVAGYATFSVSTVDQDGNVVDLQVSLFADAANDDFVAGGEAPWSTGALVGGQTYYVVAQPYSTWTFSSWKDNGSTANNRAISIPVGGSLALVAIYDNSAL